MERKIFKIFNRYSFVFVALFLIIFESINILKGQWGGDFWEHSAVVNELSKHLIHPNNPIIRTDIPHAFFSPYSLLVAIFSRITNLNSILALQFFAFFNLIFFLLSFYWFCKYVFKENHTLVAALSLLLILFFWGIDPICWSGFYHIMVLHAVLSYPSTFTISLVFLILTIIIKDNVQQSYLNSIIIIILNAVVFITHPYTALFLYSGIIALNFSFNNYSIKLCMVKSSIVIIPGLMLCFLWPYYNIIDLLIGNNADFHNISKGLYSGFIKNNWPLVLLIPSLFVIKKDKIFYFFLIGIILMFLIYISGLIFKIYGVSRLISNIMMFAHILMAYSVVLLINKPKMFSKAYLITLFIAITISLSLNNRNLRVTFDNIFKNKNIEDYNKYSVLRNLVAPDDIILSDANSNWIIPSFNGKVISSLHPIYWINDINERRNAVDSFFVKENSDSIRQFIIHKYHPKYLLIDYSKVNLKYSTFQWLKNIGQTVFKENQLELIKIGYPIFSH